MYSGKYPTGSELFWCFPLRTFLFKLSPSCLYLIYYHFVFVAFRLGARSVLYCATDPQVLKYANSLREKGWPLCAYYSSDCKPMATVRKAKDVRYMAPRVWEKTLEAIGLKNELVEKIIDGTNKMTM